MMKALWWLIGLAMIAMVKSNEVSLSDPKTSKGPRRTDIYFAAFFPMTSKAGASEGTIGPGVMPAVKLAIKHINQSPMILHGYKLKMVWNDTEVSHSFANTCILEVGNFSSFFFRNNRSAILE